MSSDNDPRVNKFSEVFKRLMRERGVTAKLVSQATGIPPSTLSEWSAGRVPKLGEDVLRLARFFGVTVDYLITGNHVEEEVVRDLLAPGVDGFAEIHAGVYRLRIEKYAGPMRRKKDC